MVLNHLTTSQNGPHIILAKDTRPIIINVSRASGQPLASHRSARPPSQTARRAMQSASGAPVVWWRRGAGIRWLYARDARGRSYQETGMSR